VVPEGGRVEYREPVRVLPQVRGRGGDREVVERSLLPLGEDGVQGVTIIGIVGPLREELRGVGVVDGGVPVRPLRRPRHELVPQGRDGRRGRRGRELEDVRGVGRLVRPAGRGDRDEGGDRECGENTGHGDSRRGTSSLAGVIRRRAIVLDRVLGNCVRVR
jgi:hypothetical protein